MLHPRYFGPQLHEIVSEKLYKDVEGSCLGRCGYVIAITSITDIGEGVVDQTGGLATFQITYKAIVFRPFKGKKLNAKNKLV